MTGHFTCSDAVWQRPPAVPRPGFTLVELLVASAIALSVMGALASLFSIFSRTASDTQAVVAMQSQMRSTANRLRQDLIGLTVPLRPPLNPESGAGYFELIEGPMSDFERLVTNSPGNIVTATTTITGVTPIITGTDSILGDVDDILLFTTRSTGVPFTGNFGTTQIESPVAEVAWFCRPAPLQPVAGLTLQNLYRRKLLVIGHIGATPFHSGTNPPGNSNLLSGSTIPQVYNSFDLSLRRDTSLGALVPNTLADLMWRDNRFPRASGTDAFANSTPPFLTGSAATTWTGLVFNASSNREGEDLILGNVIGFDVRVFDPDVQPRGTGGPFPIYPNEQGYLSLSSTTNIPSPATGGFVDLGCLSFKGLVVSATRTASSGLTDLTGPGNSNSGLSKLTLTGTATYDTWTTAWESNGTDDDGIAGVDQGTNGSDDPIPPSGTRVDVVGLPDDLAEKERPPPYVRRISAIEIRIRCFDPQSRQIRQTTVRQQLPN